MIYFIYGVLTVGFVFWVSTLLVYGWYIPKAKRELFEDVNPAEIELNMFNASIISLRRKFTISDVPVSITAKYYIRGVGIVGRWTKLHREINRYFEEAIKREFA